MSWAGHVAGVGERRDASKISVRNTRDLGISGGIILKCILEIVNWINLAQNIRSAGIL